MAPNATLYRAELQVSDLDRHYYATHGLTLARHPSETPERLMVRLLAFALFADERLVFGRGLSTDEDPDLWQRDDTGAVERWIDLGQPDERRIRRACGRARQVVVVTYSGNSADLWWTRQAAALSKLGNLTVIDIPPDTVDRALPFLARSMRLTAMIQDGELQLMDEARSVVLPHATRLAPAG